MPISSDVSRHDAFDIATPSLAEIIRDAIRNSLQSLRIAFPAAIVDVESDLTVTVQPLFQKRYLSADKPSNMAQIHNVRVMMPLGNDYRVAVPLRPRDTGLCIVLDRSMDTWMANTGDPTVPVDPNDTRAHNVSDAIFLPGLVCDAKESTDISEDIVLTNGEIEMRLGKAGTLQVKNDVGELIGTVSDLAAKVKALAGTITLPASSATAASNIAREVTALQTKLDSFKA